MRGFLVGSMTLIVLQVLLQPGTADKAAAGAGTLTGLMRRALSPGVAGIPNRAGPAPAKGVGYIGNLGELKRRAAAGSISPSFNIPGAGPAGAIRSAQ